ncbi:MAG: GNAT family N-acetyltransferase [Chloroflexota bacterium]
MQTKDLNVIHNVERNQFEIQIDSQVAELAYYLNGNVIFFTHTGVPPALEGKGIGSLLVKTGLQYARENKLKVQSLCWFVSGYMDRHLEFQDLAG